MIDRFPKTWTPWYLRLLLAALLMFGSEILLWIDPLGRDVGEWLLLIPGYIALAALLLDLATRYRIRDVYDAMALLAINGLLVGLLLNPQLALEEIPDTLVNRALGGYALLGLEMFGLFLALTGGHIRRYRRNLHLSSLWIGFYWGVWARWMPEYAGLTTRQIPLGTLLAVGGIGLIPILILFILSVKRSANLTPPDLRLSVIEWGGVLVVLVLLFMIRAAQNANIGNSFAWIAILIVLSYGVLWFRRRDKGKTLLDEHIPPTPLSWPSIGLTLVIFAGSTIVAYRLPLVELFGLNQFSLMTLGFAGVGLGWLPLIAMVLGVQALDRQARTGKL
jgi:hypothetical protein